MIRIAPDPLLSGFDRSDERMAGLLVVSPGMFCSRAVATSHLATGQAHTKVYGASALLHARRAFAGHGPALVDRVQMGAGAVREGALVSMAM